MSIDATLYGWTRCAHEGIGLPGCRVCDPDKARVAARGEYLLASAEADVARWKRIAHSLADAMSAALNADAAAEDVIRSTACGWAFEMGRAA